jgi:alanyl-tRNA synthetase
MRLYYDDPYLTRFSAVVREVLEWEGQPAVTLDRTAFYPTGGGQPSDRGTLDGIAVVDVVEREQDGAVVHLLAAPLGRESAAPAGGGLEIEGQVDWLRRQDLMQQHTGQHLLSAAFVRVLRANTVGFHLSEEYATVDLDRAPMSAEVLAQVEALANQIIFENHPVRSRFVADDEVTGLPLRKPVKHEGPVRVVEVLGSAGPFDCSACGGTHVRATGEIGLLKITRSEKRAGETRVEFLCGRRALSDYAAKNSLLMALAQEFSASVWEVPGLVHRQSAEIREVRSELKAARDALLDAEADSLWHGADRLGEVRVVQAHLSGRSAEELKRLAQRLIGNPKTVALLASGHTVEEKGAFVFARSADLDLNMGSLVRQACEAIGGRGGGRPEFAQGGGPEGLRVAMALQSAGESLRDSIVV